MKKSTSQHGFGKSKDQRGVFPVQSNSQVFMGISETVKNAKIGSHPDQNPIGVLQEMFASVDISPHYEYKTIAEDIAPVFVASVTIGEIKASARGETKKEAKSKAAKAAIDELRNKNHNPLSMGGRKVGMITKEQFEKVKHTGGSYSNALKKEAAPEETSDNAELLSNVCKEFQLPPPSYPTVHVECQVGDRVVFGSGRNPLAARHDAAQQMIALVRKERLEEWTKHDVPAHSVTQHGGVLECDEDDIYFSD